MKKVTFGGVAVFLSAIMLFLISVYFSYGTLSPCGVLRAKIQQQAVKDGSIFGKLLALAPDSVTDFALQGTYGKLTPGRCLVLLVNPDRQERHIPDKASQDSIFSRRHEPPFADAESVAKQAFDECRIASGKLLGGPYTVDDPCINTALKAWHAKEEIPPYAHPCLEKGAKVDFLGRCM